MLRTALAFLLQMKKRTLLLLLLFGIVIAYVIAIQFMPKPQQTSQVVNPKQKFDQLEPGQSIHEDIIEQLGQPEQAYELNGMTVYVYPSSTSYYTPDQLYLKNDVLQLKELHFTPEQFSFTLQRLIDNFGQPEKVLYFPYSPYTANYVYAYPEKGVVAYITKEDRVYKLHYFSPTPLETYRQRWGLDLIDAKPAKPTDTLLHQH